MNDLDVTSPAPNNTCEVDAVTSMASNIVVSVFIIIFFVVGSAGNILTIVVIAINKPLHTISNTFILSLCVSDLISATICSPLWLYRRTWGFDEWKWGEFLCKFYWTSDFTTSYVTSLHIFSFAGLRFIAVKQPFMVPKIRMRVVLMYICCLWLVAIAVAIPMMTFVGVCINGVTLKYGASWPSCSIIDRYLDDECCVEQYHLYMAITSPIFFYAPELLVVVFSISIAKSLIQRRRWRQRLRFPFQCYSPTTPGPSPIMPGQIFGNVVNENLPDIVVDANSSQTAANQHQQVAPYAKNISPIGQRYAVNELNATLSEPPQGQSGETHYSNLQKAFLQLSLIVISFVIGYIPMTVYLLWTTLNQNTNAAETDYWFGVASYFCLRFSECMNPLMYNLGSTNLSQASKRLLRRIFHRRDRPHFTVH